MCVQCLKQTCIVIELIFLSVVLTNCQNFTTTQIVYNISTKKGTKELTFTCFQSTQKLAVGPVHVCYLLVFFPWSSQKEQRRTEREIAFGGLTGLQLNYSSLAATDNSKSWPLSVFLLGSFAEGGWTRPPSLRPPGCHNQCLMTKWSKGLAKTRMMQSWIKW